MTIARRRVSRKVRATYKLHLDCVVEDIGFVGKMRVLETG